MVIIGTASNSQINDTIKFCKDKLNSKNILLIIKKGRLFSSNIDGLEISKREFEEETLSIRSFESFDKELRGKHVVIAQNTLKNVEYLSIYLGIIKKTKNLYSLLPNRVYKKITKLYCFKLILILSLIKINTFFMIYLPVKIISFLLSKELEKKSLTLLAMIFWHFINEDDRRYRRKIIFQKLKKLSLINNKRRESKEVLLISLSGIGNSLHLFPLSESLKKQYENCKITVLVDKTRNTKDLWECNSQIDRIIEIDIKNQSAIKNLLLLIKLKKYDIAIIGYSSYVDLVLLVSYIAGVYSIYVHNYINSELFKYYQVEKIDYDINKLEIENNINLIKGMVDVNNVNYPEIIVKNTYIEKIDILINNLELKNRRIIAFHAGCLNEEKFLRKRWLPERFALLAEKIYDKFGTKILLLGTEVEKDANTKIMKLAGSYCSDLTDELKLQETIILIKKCTILISNDSGLMHIANFVNTPIVAIFGPSNLIKNRPFNMENVEIIKSEIDCSPCQNSTGLFEKDCNDYKCMKEISVDEVMKRVDKLLDN